VPLEIDTIIAESKAMQGLSTALQFAKSLKLSVEHLLRKTAEFAQDEQLKFFRHSTEFCGARGVENDLE
jgi:hypothetical protein